MSRTRLSLLGLAAVVIAASGPPARAATLRQLESIYADQNGRPLKEPRGVGCNGGSTVVVADTGNRRLLRFEFQNGKLRGGTEMKVAQIPNPVRVKLGSDGEIFVLDGKQRRIARLTATGQFKSWLEPPDSLSFDVDPKNNIYLLDGKSHRAVVLDSSGKTLKSIALPRDSGFFADIAADVSGTIFLLDSMNASIYTASRDARAFSPLSNSLREWVSFPTTIASDSMGLLYLADLTGGSIIILGQQGGAFEGKGLGYGWNEGMLRYPAGLCVDQKGNAFIADKANNRVQIARVIR